MKHIVGRVLSNPAVRKVVVVAISDIIYLYARALLNVVTKKVNSFVDEKEDTSPTNNVVEVTLED